MAGEGLRELLDLLSPHQRGVTIVRVLYARRDWWQMLGVVGPGEQLQP